MADLAGIPLEVQSCLGLVAEARFADAVPVCLAAADAAPESQEVRDALAKAQREVALVEAEGAAGRALDATEAATKKLFGEAESTD